MELDEVVSISGEMVGLLLILDDVIVMVGELDDKDLLLLVEGLTVRVMFLGDVLKSIVSREIERLQQIQNN